MKLLSILQQYPSIWILLIAALCSTPHVCEGLTIAPAASGAWTWYKSMLVAKPLLTKSLTSSCIMSASDVLCQEVVNRATPEKERPSKINSIRVLHVAITGCLWSGPITHYWYIVLEK